MTRFPFDFVTRQAILTLPCIAVLLVTALAPGCRSSPTLSDGTILLGIVDTSQVSVTLPIHEQLLIVARDDTSDFYTIGYLDITNQRLIQLSRIESHSPDGIEWKPDGTQFIYNSASIGGGGSTWIFQADGKELFHEGMEAHWIGDGQYVSVWTCRASNLSGGGTADTVYNTVTWEAICRRCDGSIGAAMECYCGALSTEECPPKDVARSKTQEQRPRRYDAVIEDYRLRIIDSTTAVVQTYALPNHRIVKISWSPN